MPLCRKLFLTILSIRLGHILGEPATELRARDLPGLKILSVDDITPNIDLTRSILEQVDLRQGAKVKTTMH